MATLIHGGYVVTMNPAREVFAEGFVLLGDDGRIDAVGPSSCAPSGFAGERLDANGMIVLPGLVNAGHRPWQHLLMGLAAATDEALLGAAERLLDSEDLAVAATLAATELVSGGTTTVLHHLPQRADAQRLQAATAPFAAAGMRQLACIDHAATGQDAAEAALGACAGLAAGRMGLALSVLADPVSMAEKRVDEAALASARTFARQHGLRIVCDLSGAADDARWAAAARAQGRSAPVHLMELGLLDQDWLVAGLQRLQAADLMLIRESGCAALATPLSDAARGQASAHWTELAHHGVVCALGTGGPAFSGSADMVEEMKAMVLLQNTLRLDPGAMSTEAVLEMATLGGARALGLDQEIGSLEPGKRADVAVFDLRGPHCQVSHKPISTFVCCARGQDAHAVFVDGRCVHRPGRTGPDDTVIGAALARRDALLQRARNFIASAATPTQAATA